MPMFTNFFDLEGTVRIPHQSRNGSNVPTDPDDPPTYAVYSLPSTTPIKTGTASAFSAASTDGVSLVSFTAAAADGFASGSSYTVIVQDEVDSVAHSETYTFRVL